MSERYLDLLRHGEVRGGPCFRGQRDDPLTELGQRQMDRALRRLSERFGCSWTLVYCSPAIRCKAFAADVALRQELQLIELADFSERRFGAWEGLQADQIPLADLSAFWADPNAFTPAGGEPFAEFRRRVADAWQHLVESDQGSGLICTHGGVVRVILGQVLGIEDASLLLLEVPPACIIRVRIPVGGGLPSLVAHLPPDLNRS